MMTSPVTRAKFIKNNVILFLSIIQKTPQTKFYKI